MSLKLKVSGDTTGVVTKSEISIDELIDSLQQTALTADLTAITHTAPSTPDYALQDLTDTGGFGFKTKDEGNTLLKVVLNLQTRVAELEDKLQAIGLLA